MGQPINWAPGCCSKLTASSRFLQEGVILQKYDRLITISAAGSRKATRWPTQSLMGSELAERLKTPCAAPKRWSIPQPAPRQTDELKDVGGFVAGAIAGGGRRKANPIQGRDVITLDLDNIPAGGTQDGCGRVDGSAAGTAYITRKHEEAAPRLRCWCCWTTVTATSTSLSRGCWPNTSAWSCATRLPSSLPADVLPSCCADSQYVYA